MKVMLTSSLGGSTKVKGIRVPSVLIQHNGVLDSLKSIWTQHKICEGIKMEFIKKESIVELSNPGVHYMYL